MEQEDKEQQLEIPKLQARHRIDKPVHPRFHFEVLYKK
jgi:hypothetical protein